MYPYLFHKILASYHISRVTWCDKCYLQIKKRPTISGCRVRQYVLAFISPDPLKLSISNYELTFVSDKWQRSHRLQHMACYSSHTICHGFFTRHCCHGNKKEVNTVSHRLLVKPITLGEVPARSGYRELEQYAAFFFKFYSVAPYRNCWHARNVRSNFQFTFFGVSWRWLHAGNRVWAKEGAELSQQQVGGTRQVWRKTVWGFSDTPELLKHTYNH